MQFVRKKFLLQVQAESSQFRFDTCFKRDKRSEFELNPERPWELFSIKETQFGLTSLQKGELGKIKLIYYKKQEKFDFSIQDSTYSSVIKENESLFQSFKPKSSSKDYFIHLEVNFLKGLLSRINVALSPLAMTISPRSSAENFAAFALIQNISLEQKKCNLEILASEVFEKNLFENVHKILVQNQLDHHSK